jgi:Flp pilus assembly protein TadD
MALAEIAERNGDEEKALFLTLKATGLGFHEPEPHFKAGIYYARCGNDREALMHFTEYARMVPGDPLVFRNMAIAQARLGSAEEAARSFKKYLKLYPGAFDREKVTATVTELEQER